MAEAYDAAIRRRLSLIDDMGTGATQAVYSRIRDQQKAVQPDRQQSTWAPSSGYNMGHKYNGPRGNEQALINFGRWLQGQGFRVSEHPAFNGGRRITGGHSPNSRHYRNRAFDLNFAPGTSRREQQAIDRIIGLARIYGLSTIWRKPGHHGHAHVQF